jgi:hypothetical protein
MNYKLAEIFPWQHLVLAELPDDSSIPGALVAALLCAAPHKR